MSCACAARREWQKSKELWRRAPRDRYARECRGREPGAFVEASPALLRAAGASERGADMLAHAA